MKAYAEIKAVVMADDENIETIKFHSLPFLVEVSYDDGTIEESELSLTKDDAIDNSGLVIVSGYGTWSGRKVWQLPNNIISQIKATMKKQELK